MLYLLMVIVRSILGKMISDATSNSNCSTILEGLKKVGVNCLPFTSANETLDIGKIEKRIANSVAMVVILTKDCLQKREILFSLQAASFHYDKQHSRVILVRNDYKNIYTYKRFMWLKVVIFLSLPTIRKLKLALRIKQSRGYHVLSVHL